MKKNLLSVIIPSRSDIYLQKTIDDLLVNAEEGIELIVVLDGYRPKNPIRKDPRLQILNHGSLQNNLGMRASINKGVESSRGQYIMKIDEHCAVDQGFDKKLKADYADDWVVTPRKHGLDAKNWKISEGKRSSVDNMYFAYPYLDYHKWHSWYDRRKDVLIDDCLGMEGSCYFMSRKHWNWLGGLDEKNYGKFHYEPQEICLKTWLGGGRVMTNKKTWFAHWHRRAKGYRFSNRQYRELYDTKTVISKYVHDYWLNNRWEKRVHNIEWLVEKFWPMPYWNDDWRQTITTDNMWLAESKQAELALKENI